MCGLLAWHQVGQRGPNASQFAEVASVLDMNFKLVAPRVQPRLDGAAAAVYRERGLGAIPGKRQDFQLHAFDLLPQSAPLGQCALDGFFLGAPGLLVFGDERSQLRATCCDGSILAVAGEQRQVDPELDHDHVGARAIALPVGRRNTPVRPLVRRRERNLGFGDRFAIVPVEQFALPIDGRQQDGFGERQLGEDGRHAHRWQLFRRQPEPASKACAGRLQPCLGTIDAAFDL